MGSHEDAWLRCTYCGKWGKCLWMNNPIVNSLWDVDCVRGQLCETCLLREAPPHSAKYRRILPKVLSSETVVSILEFAFTAVAEFEARRRAFTTVAE